MKRRIAVLACGWCTYFLKDFITGMQRAVADKNIDIYVFKGVWACGEHIIHLQDLITFLSFPVVIV